MTDAELTKEIDRIVTEVGARYARKCFWITPARLQDDLRQEGWAACWRAAKANYSAGEGPLRPYLARVAAIAISSYCWRQSAPVSARSSELPELRGLFRAAEDSLESSTSPAATDPEALLIDAEEARASAELARRVRKVLAQASPAGYAARVLLEGEKPREIVAGSGAERQRVYAALARARARLRGDYDLLKRLRSLHK